MRRPRRQVETTIDTVRQDNAASDRPAAICDAVSDEGGAAQDHVGQPPFCLLAIAELLVIEAIFNRLLPVGKALLLHSQQPAQRTPWHVPWRSLGRLLRMEQQRFPDWQEPVENGLDDEKFCDREEAEWRLADVILCGSSFVRDGIADCGGPVGRCVILPYGIDGRFHLPPRPAHGGPLRILTVGTVGLRKGSPYVLAAARALKRQAIFRMVGAIDILPRAAAFLSEAVE